jgi:ArsR family transcriptional regulator
MKCYSDFDMQDISDTLGVISQVNRLQIICLLEQSLELSVCEISEKLKIKQNLVSHHLKLLKNIWVLKSKKDWQKVFYSINEKFYEEFKMSLKNILNM